MKFTIYTSLLLLFTAATVFSDTADSIRAPILQGTGGGPTNIVPPPDTLVGEHCDEVYYDFDYLDPTGGTGVITFRLAPGDPGEVDSLTGEYTYQPTYADINHYLSFTMHVCRPATNCSSRLIWMRITNDPPAIVSGCDTVINTTIGSKSTVTVGASDCPTDPRSFMILDTDGAVGQLGFKANTGELSFTPAQADLGRRDVVVGVTDGVDTTICVVRFNVPGASSISLDSVIGLESGTIAGGRQTSFNLRVTTDPNVGLYISAYSNGFRIFSPDGATWSGVNGQYLPEWPLGAPTGFDNVAVGTWGTDGLGDDTVAFAGAVIFSQMGAPPGFSAASWQISVQVPRSTDLDGLSLCLDTTTHFPPTNQWKWVDRIGTDYFPTWDGPHCYPITVTACCAGLTGNVNGDISDNVDISDLTTLVNYLFVTYQPLPCPAEANVNGDTGCNIDISDLTALVNHLFVTFQTPAPCTSSCE